MRSKPVFRQSKKRIKCFSEMFIPVNFLAIYTWYYNIRKSDIRFASQDTESILDTKNICWIMWMKLKMNYWKIVIFAFKY